MSARLTAVIAIVCTLQGCAATQTVTRSNGPALPTRVTADAAELKDAKPRPSVIYMHGCSGLDGAHAEWAKTISSWGYNVVQPDSLTPRNVQTTCAAKGVGPVTHRERLNDLNDVAEWVKKQPWHKGKVGAIGFSMGAGVVMNAATRGGFEGYGSFDNKHVDAVVAYYPLCAEEHTRTATIAIQVHVGELDRLTPANRCLVVKLAGTADVFIYPGVHHSFDVIGANSINRLGYVIRYDHSAAKAAEESTRAFFEKHLR